MSESAATRRGTATCAHTEFECECDCACGRLDIGGYHDEDCLWPDCACGCAPDCKGCAMAQEAPHA